MKRIRTNRRRRMKLKNFIACVTTLSVVMGSSYFALANDFVPAGGMTTFAGEITKAPEFVNTSTPSDATSAPKELTSVKDIMADLKANPPKISADVAANLKELPPEVRDEIMKEKLEGIVEKAPDSIIQSAEKLKETGETPAQPDSGGEKEETGTTLPNMPSIPKLPNLPSIDLPADFQPKPVLPDEIKAEIEKEKLEGIVEEAPEEIIISHHKLTGHNGGGAPGLLRDEDGFTRAEKVIANYVLGLVNNMPTLDEIDAKASEFETEEEWLAWGEAALAEREEVLREYMTLNDAQKAWIREYVENLDELIALVGEVMLYTTADIGTVRGDDIDNVTVRVFNYDNSVNSTSLAKKGYVFFHSSYGAYKIEDELTDAEKKYWNTRGSVDGMGASHPDATVSNTYNRPKLEDKLKNGYPYVNGTKADGTEVEGSLDYLFDGTYLKGEMSDGGDLFQTINGYHVYDSAENAAYFNGSEFELYDAVVVPYYNEGDGSAHSGNFLPFNQVRGSREVNGEDSPWAVPFYEYTDGEKNAEPVEGKYKLNVDNPTDNWFGMTVEFSFFMPKDGQLNGEDMVFEFSGDDDVWVFIDDTLVMDIGGTHGVQEGKINFATGQSTFTHNVVPEGGGNTDKTLDAEDGNADGITETTWDFKDIYANTENADSKIGEGEVTFADYTLHTFKFFYMERGGNISNCKIKFNMPTLPENSLIVGKELAVDNEEVNFVDAMTYKFRVVKENGDLFVPANKEFEIRDTSLENVIGEGETDENGIFELKAGQRAVFPDVMGTKGENKDVKYIVQELIPEKEQGQYNGVEYRVGETSGKVTEIENGVTINTVEFKGYETEPIKTTDVHSVIFTNGIATSELGSLTISKTVSDDSLFDADETFDVKVKLGDMEKDTSVPYTLTKVDGTTEAKTYPVDNKGVGTIELMAGETARIDGILSGTAYEVCEAGTGFTPVYTRNGTVVDGEKVTGTFDQADNVVIGIKNYSDDFEMDIPLEKTTYGVKEEEKFTFKFDVVLDHVTLDDPTASAADFDDDLNLIVERAKGDTSSTQKDSSAYTLNFANDMPDGTYYFKVTEKTDGYPETYAGRFNYDTTVYLLGIKIDQDAADHRATLVSYQKNGVEQLEAGASYTEIPTLLFKNTTPGGGGGSDKKYIDVTVNKKWAGELAEGEKHPDSVQVQLWINGGAYGKKVTLSEKNDWTYTWENIRVDEDGTDKIQVMEDTVSGYTSETEQKGNSFTITNTKSSDPDNPKKPEDPKDPKDPPKDTPKDDDGDVLGIDEENVPKSDMVLADEEEVLVEEEVLTAETGDSNHPIAAGAVMIAALAGMFLLKKKKEN